jgi:hypothetical protein
MLVEAEPMHPDRGAQPAATILRPEQGVVLDLPLVPPARLLLSTGNL